MAAKSSVLIACFSGLNAKAIGFHSEYSLYLDISGEIDKCASTHPRCLDDLEK
jgi:hypothetical protein